MPRTLKKGKRGGDYFQKDVNISFQPDKNEAENCIFLSGNISTQPNTDDTYREVGIVHLTDTAGINAIRGFATELSNFFGSKGFDNPLIDHLRNKTLARLNKLIGPNQKVCNLRMEIDSSAPKLMFHHVYGTLLQKK
jgi:hypothetical protein